MRSLSNRFFDALSDTDRAEALEIIREAVARGTPESVVFDLVIPAIDRMMESLAERGDVSLAQHYLAAQIASEAVEEMLPRFANPPASRGRVVIGTSHGDFHGLGKRIVGGCLRARMFDVLDLGLNVSPEAFVAEAEAKGATVIAISSMMLHTALGPGGPQGVRALLRGRGLERRIKLIVGGAPYRYDHDLWRAVEADAWAESGLEAASVAERLAAEACP